MRRSGRAITKILRKVFKLSPEMTSELNLTEAFGLSSLMVPGPGRVKMATLTNIQGLATPAAELEEIESAAAVETTIATDLRNLE